MITKSCSRFMNYTKSLSTPIPYCHAMAPESFRKHLQFGCFKDGSVWYPHHLMVLL